MRNPKRLVQRGFDRNMSAMHVSELRRCIKHYFLDHPVIRAIKPIVRGTRHGFGMTSPFFVTGLTITFDAGGVDIMLIVKNSISDWMGFHPCSPLQVSRNQYINAESLRFYDHENENELTDRPVSELQKYASLRAVYEAECLDPLIRNIESGKLLRAIEWKDWGGYAAAHFEGYPPSVGDIDTHWLYPAKRLVKPIGPQQNDKPV